MGAALLAVYAISDVARGYLAENGNAAAVAPAILTELATGGLGVAWSDPLAPIPSTRTIARRVAEGAGMGVAAAAIAAAVIVAARIAPARAGAPGLDLIAALIAPVFLAVRHELLAHGLLFRAMRASPTWAKLAAGSLASGAWTFGHGAWLGETVVSVAGGFATSYLWIRDRGAWRAMAAHGAWAFMVATVLRGGVVDVGPASGHLGGLDGGVGVSLIGALVIAAVAIVGIWRDRGRPRALSDAAG